MRNRNKMKEKELKGENVKNKLKGKRKTRQRWIAGEKQGKRQPVLGAGGRGSLTR
jgi:hypothetical protein